MLLHRRVDKMALYTISDLHLSLGVDKPMDIFGGAWTGYEEKLRENLSVLKDDDTIVFPGDISWGISLDEALEDFRFIDSFPGRKIIVKGNHDLWWDTVSKMRRFFQANGIGSIDFLHNNCFFYGDIALCGTRGWFFEEEQGQAHDEKIMAREVGRLETSLKAGAAGAGRIFCFMHYPPIFQRYVCREITEMLTRYGVERCFYGHLHSASHRKAFEGTEGGVRYTLVSGDYVGFDPILIKE